MPTYQYINGINKIDSYKSKIYKSPVYSNNKHITPHPKQALQCIMFPTTDYFDIPSMKFILKRLQNFFDIKLSSKKGI